MQHAQSRRRPRRFLGHKNIATTVKFYAEIEMRDAAKILDEAIGRRRAALANPARAPSRVGIVNIAHVMLGNSLATTERFYNLAQTLEVGRLVGDTLARLRSKLQAA